MSAHIKKKKLTKLVNFCIAILLLKMQENMQHFPHIFCHFKKGKNAPETQKKICAVCGKGAVTDRICQKGFENFVLEISHWTMLHGRPVEVDSDQIETLIKNSQRSVFQEITDMLKIPKSIKLLVKLKDSEIEKYVLFYGKN